jgi:hypothetical protein
MADKVLVTQYEVVITVENVDQAKLLRRKIQKDFVFPSVINRRELVSQNNGAYKFRVTEAINGC